MIGALRTGWHGYAPDTRRHLINAALFGLTLDGGVNAVIFNLYVLRLGYGPEFVGLIGSIGMLAFALMSLPAGRLGARIGLQRTMLIGAAITAIAALLVLLAPALPTALIGPALGGCILLTNIGLAGYYANATPYLASTTVSANHASVFSIQSALYASAGFIGSLIGGWLPQLFAPIFPGGVNGPMPYLLTLLVVPAVLLFITFSLTRMREPALDDEHVPALKTAASPSKDETRARPLSAAQIAGRAAFVLIVLFALMRFLQVGVVGAATTFFNVYMDQQFGVATSVIGGFQAAAKLIGIPVALTIPWFTKRFGVVAVTLVATMITIVAMLPMALAPIWWVAGLSYMAVWIVTPVRYAAFTVFTMDRTPNHLRSTMNGAQEMFAGLSFAMIAFSGGLLINAFGYAPLFLLGALLSFGSLILLWVYSRSHNNLR